MRLTHYLYVGSSKAIRFYKELCHVVDYIYNRFGTISTWTRYTTRTGHTPPVAPPYTSKLVASMFDATGVVTRYSARVSTPKKGVLHTWRCAYCTLALSPAAAALRPATCTTSRRWMFGSRHPTMLRVAAAGFHPTDERYSARPLSCSRYC